jgi:quercetin dioxygenase-like cupin family protein
MTFEVIVLRAVADSRGWLFEPLLDPELSSQRNVHVVLTQPGQVRGNHFHRLTAELIAVAGPALVRVRVAGVTQDHRVPAGEAHRFSLPPGTPHAILNTGIEVGLCVSFTDRVHDPLAPDTCREVLIEPGSP